MKKAIKSGRLVAAPTLGIWILECRGGRLQHIFLKNPVPPRWIIHQDMGHGAHEFSVLDDGGAAHE